MPVNGHLKRSRVASSCLKRVLQIVLATEINALRLEIIDGVNLLLKLPLISYVVDNVKTIINQVIVAQSNRTPVVPVRTTDTLTDHPVPVVSPQPVRLIVTGRVVLRVHRLDQKNTERHSQADQPRVRFDVHGGRQRNEVR